MKKINNTALIIGGAIVLIGGLAFMLLRKPKPKLNNADSNDNVVDNTNTNTNTAPVSSSKEFELVGFVQKPGVTNYSVLTAPFMFSGKKKDLESFTTVYARPSSTNGWMEVSEDNKTVLGYVPNLVLRKL